MHKNKKINEDLAIDALLAATCRTGALDPAVSAKDAEALAGEVTPLTRQEQAVFKALGNDFIAALRKRVMAAERHAGVGFVPLPQKPLYAADIDQMRGAARSVDKLHRARKRMKKFLGE